MLDRPPGRRSARRWLLAPASAAALAGAAVQPSLKGVSADVAGGRVTIGAIWPGASLIGAALAQANGSVTLENVTFESSSATYRLPRVEFVGASLSRDDLARLLDPKAAEPWRPVSPASRPSASSYRASRWSRRSARSSRRPPTGTWWWSASGRAGSRPWPATGATFESAGGRKAIFRARSDASRSATLTSRH